MLTATTFIAEDLIPTNADSMFFSVSTCEFCSVDLGGLVLFPLTPTVLTLPLPWSSWISQENEVMQSSTLDSSEKCLSLGHLLLEEASLMTTAQGTRL